MIKNAIIMPASNDSDVSDDDLVREAKCDKQAFAQLFRRYASSLFRYLYSRVGNIAESEDLTTQVFIDVIEGLVNYTPRGNFAAWLFTIARRRVIDFHRKSRGDIPLDCVEHSMTSEMGLLSLVIEQENLAMLRSVISGLKDSDQELLRLRYAAELDYRTISKVLGQNEAWLRLKIHRLLKKIKKRMEDYDE